MTAAILYRIAAVLLLLFAIAHSIGFARSDPAWGVGEVVSAMRSARFDVQGFERSYWDFFVGAGLTVSVLYLLAAALAWQLGGLPAATLSQVRGISWTFAIAFIAIGAVSWRYLFAIPLIFCLAISVCLAGAAWIPMRRGERLSS